MSEKNKLVGALNALKRIAEPIRAYHGTPHKFDRFDISKIGTGEGAQAYGHGLYFAELEPVAKGYRDRLTAGSLDDIVIDGMPYNPHSIKAYKDNPSSLEHDIGLLKDRLADYNEMHMDRRIISNLEYDLNNLIKLKNFDFGKLNFPSGHMYEVNLHVPREHLLDWERPISEQSEHVRRALGVAIPNETQMRDRLSQLESMMRERASKSDFSDLDKFWADSDFYEKPAVEASSIRQQLSAGVPRSHPLYNVPRETIEKMTGADIARPYSKYENRKEDAKQAASALLDAGIPGIQFLDQGSRGAGTGTRNFVMFDDAPIEVVRRYARGGLNSMKETSNG
jgi:hypothetical protein